MSPKNCFQLRCNLIGRAVLPICGALAPLVVGKLVKNELQSFVSKYRYKPYAIGIAFRDTLECKIKLFRHMCKKSRHDGKLHTRCDPDCSTYVGYEHAESLQVLAHVVKYRCVALRIADCKNGREGNTATGHVLAGAGQIFDF